MELPGPPEEPAVEVEGVDDLELTAAGEELLALRRKAEAVEGLIDGHPASDLGPPEIDEHHFMGSIPGVEDGKPLAAGMQCQVDGEVA